MKQIKLLSSLVTQFQPQLRSHDSQQSIMVLIHVQLYQVHNSTQPSILCGKTKRESDFLTNHNNNNNNNKISNLYSASMSNDFRGAGGQFKSCY